jgi:hypothetical protein
LVTYSYGDQKTKEHETGGVGCKHGGEVHAGFLSENLEEMEHPETPDSDKRILSKRIKGI